MIAVNCWGKNIYIDKELSGFIAPSGDMYAKEGYKFGSLSKTARRLPLQVY